jgi:hypothetical protein
MGEGMTLRQLNRLRAYTASDFEYSRTGREAQGTMNEVSKNACLTI